MKRQRSGISWHPTSDQNNSTEKSSTHVQQDDGIKPRPSSMENSTES